MNSVTKDVAEILAGESSLGLIFATNLFNARQPDSPDSCVTLYDLAGGAPQLTFKKDTSDYFINGLLVRCRENLYQDAVDSAQAILDYLHAFGKETWNGTEYMLIRAINTPQLLEWDEKDRAVVIVSYDVHRKPA